DAARDHRAAARGREADRDIRFAPREIHRASIARELDLDVPPALVEAREPRREVVARDRGRRRDPDQSMHGLVSARETLDPERLVFDPIGEFADFNTLGRELKTFVRSLEEFDRELLFERRDTPRNRRVLDAEAARGAGQAAFARERDKEPEVVPIHRLCILARMRCWDWQFCEHIGAGNVSTRPAATEDT